MGRTVTQGCPNGAGSARKHAPSNVEATPCSLFQLISAYAYTREGFTRNASSAFNVDGGRTNVPSPFRTNVNRASFPMPMTISSRGWLRVASEYLRRRSRVNESVPRAPSLETTEDGASHRRWTRLHFRTDVNIVRFCLKYSTTVDTAKGRRWLTNRSSTDIYEEWRSCENGIQ